MAKFLSQVEARTAVESGNAAYISRGRTYAAKVGLTVHDDLRNAAKGIDEWVRIDGGNAYVLRDYKWVTIDGYGTTQLNVAFDVLKLGGATKEIKKSL